MKILGPCLKYLLFILIIIRTLNTGKVLPFHLLNPNKECLFSRCCSTECFMYHFSQSDLVKGFATKERKSNCTQKELFSFKLKFIVKMGNFASGKYVGFCIQPYFRQQMLSLWTNYRHLP